MPASVWSIRKGQSIYVESEKEEHKKVFYDLHILGSYARAFTEIG